MQTGPQETGAGSARHGVTKLVADSDVPLPRFCLTLPADPSPREMARLRTAVRALAGRIAGVIGPDFSRWPELHRLLDVSHIPCLTRDDAQRGAPAAGTWHADAVVILDGSPPAEELPGWSAPLGTWAFSDGDPRYDSESAGLGAAIAQGRARVAMTLRPANGGGVLSFADAPRRPWDGADALYRRLDAYLPQMIDEACERAAGAGGLEIGAPRPGQNQSRARLEMLKDAKFLTHVLFNGLAPFFAKNRTVVLLLHNPPADILDSTLATLRRIAPFIPYSRVVDDIRRGRPSEPGFALTFDDGYKENMALLDVLEAHQCTAMFFLNTATIDDTSALWFMNPDVDILAHKPLLKSLDYDSFLAEADKAGLTHPSALRGRFGLRSEDVRILLARGQEIGVHTHNHPFLTRLTDDEIRKEVTECIERLRRIAGDRLPLHFAYPDGDHDERVVAVLEDMGMESAAIVRPGPVTGATHYLKIPRYQLGDLDYPGLALFKLTRAYPALQAIRPAMGL